MKKVNDFLWHKGMTVEELVDDFGSLGYQSIELNRASEVILNMKRNNSKIFLTFTSNMVRATERLTAVYISGRFSAR